jgi:hypothetical protein
LVLLKRVCIRAISVCPESLDDARSESIWKEHLTLPVGQRWSDLDDYDFWFSGEEAVAIGIAHEIGELRRDHEHQFIISLDVLLGPF